MSESKLYKITPDGTGGFVAELNSEMLSGVARLPNIILTDSCETRLIARAVKIVKDTLYPTDPVVRRLMAGQRLAHQQELFPKPMKGGVP